MPRTCQWGGCEESLEGFDLRYKYCTAHSLENKELGKAKHKTFMAGREQNNTEVHENMAKPKKSFDCPHGCGGKVPDQTAFCGTCGESIDWEDD